MTSLTAWSAANARWSEPDGRVTPEALRWMRDLYLRVGGSDPTNLDSILEDLQNIEQIVLAMRPPQQRFVDDAQQVLATQIYGP